MAFRKVRAAAACAAVVASTFATCLGACSGTDGASSSGSIVPDDDGGASPDGGATGARADSGCAIQKVGPKSGTVAVSVAREGVTTGLPWGSPEAALTPADDAFARVTLAEGQESEMLRITGFGFVVPEKATVLGAVVEFKRRAEDAGIVDGLIELTFSGGRTSGRPKFMASAWPRVQVGTHHYGAPEDRWGNDIFPADVMSPEFGVEIWAKRQADAGADPLEALIDSMRIEVFYCIE